MTIKKSSQVTGNIGLYYVCYQLAKRGWNVMPTSRNAKGVDIMIYNQDASIKHTIQVKSLTNKIAVPLGTGLDNLQMADYLIICTGVYTDHPEVFIANRSEIKNKIHKDTNERGQISNWVEKKDYEQFAGRWEIIEGAALEDDPTSKMSNKRPSG